VTSSTPDIPNALIRYRSIVESGLKVALNNDSSSSYLMMRYYMGWSDVFGGHTEAMTGKYIRPSLCLLAAESTGTDLASALPTSLSLELIHNFSLIHDDIQDRDEVRHNRKTLWVQWGIPKALMAGNLMYVLANQLTDLNFSDSKYNGIAKLLSDACLKMIEGQYLDLSFEGKFDLTVPQYLDMVSRKTGALLTCSVVSGLELGNCTTTQKSHLTRAASSLGYAFQIRDDILGTWGDQSSIGKPVGSDIRRRKNALPIVHLMNHTTLDARETVLKVMGLDSIDDDGVHLILEQMESVKTYEFCQGLAEEFCSTAIDEIEAANLPERFQIDFIEVINFVTKRIH